MIKVEQIKELLARNSEVSAYEINQTVNEGRQLYYVSDKLETSRAVKTESITVTVYHDFEQFRGSSNFNVTANDTEESIIAKIASTVEKAAQVKNPYYPLAENVENVDLPKQLEEPIIESLKKAADSIFSVNNYPNTDLNATEIFGDINHERFVNSNGVDHKYDEVSLFVETIPSYNTKFDEYELYYNENDGTLNPDTLAGNIDEALKNVRYRAEARRISEVELPEDVEIHIKGEMLGMIMNSFAQDLSYRNQYLQGNHFSVGDEISPKPFSLILKGELEGALASSPVDEHGLKLGETKIVDHGKAAALWGDIRFGTYMKQENITGSYPVLVLDEFEPASEEEMKKPHITIMNFSSPQLEGASGYFGGEVRLALYENNGEIIPLTGFSIAGNIYEAIKTASFSKERDFVNSRRGSFEGPKYMVLKGMSIQ